MIGRVQVFGPAYLDRVLRVDRPLLGPDVPPLDQSVEGRARFDAEGRLEIVDPVGTILAIELPDDWPGPRGLVELDRPIAATSLGVRELRAEGWSDDLGGMGSGFAAALGGTLVGALGPEGDPTSRAIEELLDRHGVLHQCLRVSGRPADWTLLVSSGSHGDKLAIGFRGCHAALGVDALGPALVEGCELRVVAGLPNRLAAVALRAPGARLRLFAPAMRNMIDREPPVSAMAGAVDVLCCNRREWEALEDREEVAARLSILVVTDGPSGSLARYTDPQGDARTIREPAFPRARPPRDTNRAGEAFAACFTSTLLHLGWEPESGVIADAVIAAAMRRAAAASALVLDRVAFGFPTDDEIDAVVARGCVE
jgi:ribokinase